MGFRLLGPLEVDAGDKLLKLGSARQQVILAALLLNVNRVVPFDQLIEAVWDDALPVTARAQVQTCISALRQKLSLASADQAIKTHPVGYAISLPDSELDIALFQSLSSRGRAIADHRPEEAVADLRDALKLWRGPAAAGIDSKLVQALATRLNESRLSLIEDCIDLELRLGRHHDLTAELSELVVQHPLRERLRGQHILALYRSERQAEALASFRECREILMTELGVDPGEQLAMLELAVLSNDPALDLKTDTKWAPGWVHLASRPVPRQLPAATADFVGRANVLDSLSGYLRATSGGAGDDMHPPVAALTGKGGVGKTAVALHVAHVVRDCYPDGTLYSQLQSVDGQSVNPLEVMGEFMRALGAAPAAVPQGPAERTAMYRSMLSDRRVLVFLDDVTSGDQVTPLIPGGPGCAVIITSRSPVPGLPGARYYEIDDLDEQTSVELLAKFIGEDRVRAEEEAARTLVRLCGCLPLALRIVAAKMAERPHWRIDQMVRRMTNEGRRLDELALNGVGIRSTIQVSYDNLPIEAQRLLRRLSILEATNFPGWVSAPLLDASIETASDLLDTLVAARLVEVRVREDGPPRFRMHDLIRIFASEQLANEEPAPVRMAALQRMLRCWLTLATEAHRRSYGGDFFVIHGNSPAWRLAEDVIDELLANPLSWFREERANLVSAIYQARQAGLDELCWDLSVTSVTLFESDFHVDDWRRTHEAALEITQRTGNRRGQAAILYSLGCLAVGQRLSSAAHYLGPALRIFSEIGDVHGCALTNDLLAFASRLAGRYDEARELYQNALRGFREVSDLAGEIDALTNIAHIAVGRGEFEVAESLIDQGLVICGSLKAPRIRAQTEYRFAEFLLRRGELDRAGRSYGVVLQMVRGEGDRVGEIYALLGLGIVQVRRGEHKAAEASLRTALSLSGNIGENIVRGRILLAFTELYLAKGDITSATSTANEALFILSDIRPAETSGLRLLEVNSWLTPDADGNSRAAAALEKFYDLLRDIDPAGPANMTYGYSRPLFSLTRGGSRRCHHRCRCRLLSSSVVCQRSGAA